MSSTEPRIPNPRVPDEGVTNPWAPDERMPDELITYPRPATMAGAERTTDRPSRRDLRISHRLARALLRADQRRARAAHRTGIEVDRRLPDRTLGYPRPDTVTARHDRLTGVVTEDLAAGATVHRRLPWAARYLPPLVALMDGVVLFSFCAEVFTVDYAHPVSAATPAAAMLAVLGSGVAYVWLAVTGLRIRSYRNGLGEVEWTATRSLTRGMLVVALVTTTAFAVLMYARVSAEVAGSGPTGSGGGLVGAVFAVLSAMANLTVIAVHALDGSDVAAELRYSGRLLLRRERRLSRLLRITQRRAQREDRIALRGQQHGGRWGPTVSAAFGETAFGETTFGPRTEPPEPTHPQGNGTTG